MADTVPANGWHYEWNGSALGPTTVSALKLLLAEGRITAATNVWHPTLSEWKPVHVVFPESVPPPLPGNLATSTAGSIKSVPDASPTPSQHTDDPAASSGRFAHKPPAAWRAWLLAICAVAAILAGMLGVAYVNGQQATRRLGLTQCLDTAKSNYKSDWAFRCDQLKAKVEAYDDCYKYGWQACGTASELAKQYSDPACPLPQDISDSVRIQRKTREDDCYKRDAAGLFPP